MGTGGGAASTVTTSTSSTTSVRSTSSTTTITSTGTTTSTASKTVAFSTITTVSTLPTPGSITTSTATTQLGNCDAGCVDAMDSAACREADVEWSMCVMGSTHWTSRCQATCARCGSALPPCGQCDHKCTNLRSETECETENRRSGGAICSGGWGVWWLNQCRSSCGACEGALLPCSQDLKFPLPLPPLALASTGSNNQEAGQTGLVMSSCFRRIVPLLPLAVILVLHDQE